MGYGSAKTSTGAAEFLNLAFSTPNGVGLVGAATYPQLERTSKKQVMDMLPAAFIARQDKKDNVVTLTNGYEIMFRSFDDEQKLRSLNLAHVFIEESNGIQFSIFTQLQTRLRHHATDKHKIILTTNPDMNWIRTEILLKSDRIYGTKEKYPQNYSDINRNISTHIATTAMNTYLPDGYIESVKIGKPDFWIRRYLEGSFNFREGSVYPQFSEAVVDMDYEEVLYHIQHSGWRVMGGADFGIVDDTVLLLGAIDPKEGIMYIYDEYFKNRLSVAAHANTMKHRMQHIPVGGLIKLVGDPSGKRRNINDSKSIFDSYRRYGIHFQAGDNRIDTGIMKVYSFLEMGKIKILSRCTKLINEGINYAYKQTDLDEKQDEKPIDKENHGLDVLRYMTMELPEDFDVLKSVSYGHYDIQFKSESHLPHALQENEDDGVPVDWYSSY